VLIGLGVGFVLGAAANAIAEATASFRVPLLAVMFADPMIYAALALMLVIAILASLIPARRALRVDPVVALRHD